MRLFHLYHQNGDLAARQTLIKSQLILVVTLARKFAKTHKKNELQDLLQAGLVGLLHASDKFDPKQGVRFGSYAKYWVRREIQIVVRKNLRIAYIPRTSLRDKIFVQILRYHKKTGNLTEMVRQIQKETGASSTMVKEMIMSTLTSDVSLNTSITSSKHNIQPEDQSELVDILPSKAPSPEEAYQQSEISQIILEALDSLKPHEKKLIMEKYFADKNNREVSEGINRGVVSMLNLELKIRNKLKKKLRHIKPS
ncbi:MAG: sigma-70 family RNA polymerase sigma factor [Magnetococcales bacterium]|nr:sigma-70 family RNA polymerase sigma factor [Magnetococcales bacterium]